MTIKELYEKSINVDDWTLSINGESTPVHPCNPAIMAGIGKFHVQSYYVDFHDGRTSVDITVATRIETD